MRKVFGLTDTLKSNGCIVYNRFCLLAGLPNVGSGHRGMTWCRPGRPASTLDTHKEKDPLLEIQAQSFA